MTIPMLVREFQFELLDNPGSVANKKKIIFIDKPIRQRIYSKRELNSKYSQRSFRSLLLSTTGGKRETNNNQFYYSSFNNKSEFQVTEIKKTPPIEKSPLEQAQQQHEETKTTITDEDDDEDEGNAMIISTGKVFLETKN